MLSLQKWLRVNFIAAQMHATCAGFSYSTRIFHHKNAKRNKTEWLTVVFVYKHQHAHTRTYLTLSLLHVSIFNLARILKWQIDLHGCCWGTAPFASFLLILLSPKIHKSQISRFHSKSIALHACCIRQSLQSCQFKFEFQCLWAIVFRAYFLSSTTG